MPAFDGAIEWLNSEPLGPAELRGHAVLVNFWTLTCINWLRQEPYVRAWSEAYRDDGLIVIGVHTPEFSFEHDIEGVRHATEERAIDYSVAVDDEYTIWGAFDNHFWPALYLVDADGIIRDNHFGEGRYEQSERVIQRLLGVERELVSVEGLGVEAAADWDQLRTPETYLGYARDQQAAPRDGLNLNEWALVGDWKTGPENVALEQAGGSIVFRFHARDAHLVLSPGAHEPIPFRVLLDGEAPGPSHGVDVDEDGNGLLRDGRMYQLVRQRDGVRERTLEITFLEPGAEAYAFTFGGAEVDDWVIVGVARSEAEAELLSSVLRGSAIEGLTQVTNSGAGAGDGLGTAGAHNILVSAQDAQAARAILHEPR